MAASDIEVLPVLHARKGKLVGPDGTPMDADLKELGRRFSREYDAVYLVDLHGLRKNKPDVGLVQELAARVPVWVDAGSRFHQDVMDLLIAGAEQVTIRYETAKDRTTVEETLRLTEQVALGVEFQGQELVPNPRWPATPPDLMDLASEYRIPLVVVDLDRAGTAQGIDKSVAWHGRNHRYGSYFAGGIAKQRDLGELAGMGYQGALVATALLEGASLDGKKWPGVHPAADDADEADAAGPPPPAGDPGQAPDWARGGRS